MGDDDYDIDSAAAVAGRWFTVLSHVAYLPAIAALVYRNRFGDALLFLYLTVVSTVYHVLDSHFFDSATGRDVDFWAHADLLFSLWGLIAAADHIIGYRTPKRRRQYLMGMLASAVFWWAIVPRSVSDFTQVVLVMIVLTVYLVKRMIERRPSRISTRVLVVAYLFAAGGATLQVVAASSGSRMVYLYTHSLWHIGTGLASFAVFAPSATAYCADKKDVFAAGGGAPAAEYALSQVPAAEAAVQPQPMGAPVYTQQAYYGYAHPDSYGYMQTAQPQLWASPPPAAAAAYGYSFVGANTACMRFDV